MYPCDIGGILTGDAIVSAYHNGDIVISNFDESRVNPNSYNLRLSNEFKRYMISYKDDEYIDISKGCKTQDIMKVINGELVRPDNLYLKPGEFVLGTTIESIFTDKYIPIITGRSSVGRYSISVHQEAGFGDVGFSGRWTLQISTQLPVMLKAGMDVCQVYFITPHGPINGRLYNGKYQHADGPIESRLYEDYR